MYDTDRSLHRKQSSLVPTRANQELYLCKGVNTQIKMFKLVMLITFAAALLVSPAVAKPQLLVDYGYYSPAAYVSSYSAPLAYSYSYPYAYSYSYPLAYY